MRSKEEILSEMIDAMPFNISKNNLPYIEEAMSIYANEVTEAFAKRELELMQTLKHFISLFETSSLSDKTLNNTNASETKENVPDTKLFGNVDLFQLICKASSKEQGWMKSTKAMETGNGVVIQVTTQQGNNIAEDLVFVPDVSILEDPEGNKYIGLK